MTLTVQIKSPLSGWLMPLANVPDPVFAQGMAGDGMAIDPTSSTLTAPCDGVIVRNPNTPHALSIRIAPEVDLLLHVGIDTVKLQGQGFTVLVANGESVKAGQALLKFDLDNIANHATSAITPILLSAAVGKIVSRAMPQAVRCGDVLFDIELDMPQPATAFDSGECIQQQITVGFEQGLHARPAAQLAAILRPFEAAVTVHFNQQHANARSMVALMSLGIRHLDVIHVQASGEDAEPAMQAVRQYFAVEALQHGGSKPALDFIGAQQVVDGELKAVIASRGLAIGQALHLQDKAIEIVEQGKSPAFESKALNKALLAVKTHLESQLHGHASVHQGIVSAHIELLQDPELMASSQSVIAQGKSAGFAWQQASAHVVAVLKAVDNVYMNERVADLRDIEQYVLKALSGLDLNAQLTLPEHSILLVDELLPSQLLALDANAIAGICSAGGGPGAHAAIIAASLGIPFLVAAGPAVHSIAGGTDLILDAEQGLLCIAPEQRRVDAIRQAIALRHMQDQRDKANAMLPTRSRDGVAITVYANLGASTEVPQAMANGAEGCGLFRTEFLFLDRQNAPDEQEQFELYQEVCNQMGGKPVTIRTMDIGGDKPIPYLALPREENPALGLRGIRTSLWRDALFIDQLRAILRLPADSGARILLPMINDSAEVAMAKSYILRCAEDLGIKQLPEIGIMIETPASVMLIEQLLGMVDFVSIGSNDLSQYVLAIDRGHPELAGKLDALHPAVLRMIQHAAQAAKAANKKISLCGGLASDPVALAVLLGLGVLELSVLPTLIPRVKSLLRQFDLRACQALALDAINEKDAASVRALCTEFIARSGHGVFS